MVRMTLVGWEIDLGDDDLKWAACNSKGSWGYRGRRVVEGVGGRCRYTDLTRSYWRGCTVVEVEADTHHHPVTCLDHHRASWETCDHCLRLTVTGCPWCDHSTKWQFRVPASTNPNCLPDCPDIPLENVFRKTVHTTPTVRYFLRFLRLASPGMAPERTTRSNSAAPDPAVWAFPGRMWPSRCRRDPFGSGPSKWGPDPPG